ncbi:MAG TPA: hypothetical protein VFO29_11420 [Candidatus Rubrimentiphilum sp.]|nr:hypothetical protein [Candidatus Rubrimentiphilum sp.]
MNAIVVNAAAMLLESAPFVLAGAIAVRLPWRWSGRLTAYLGCGCGAGPSARSLPAAAAAWLVFGPFVAAARLGGALLMECALRKRDCAHGASSVLAQFGGIWPLAIAGAILVPLFPAIAEAHAPPEIVFAAAGLAAFISSPCGLGTIGIAAMARTVAPPAAAGFLCVAGIVDLRAFVRVQRSRHGHDCLAYALASLACALVALRGGAALVNPKIALALWPCAIAFAYLTFRYRRESCAALRVGPMIMLAGCMLAAPAPIYRATETTLADAFAGERVDFTGVVVRSGKATALVRYAITCCRADAAPIAIRLDSPLTFRSGWAHARGALVQRSDGLRLHADSIEPVSAPLDPFVYR